MPTPGWNFREWEGTDASERERIVARAGFAGIIGDRRYAGTVLVRATRWLRTAAATTPPFGRRENGCGRRSRRSASREAAPNTERRGMTFLRGPEPAQTVPDRRCDHGGVLMVHRVVGGSVARCLGCQTIGPVRPNAVAAHKALLVLGARDRHR